MEISKQKPSLKNREETGEGKNWSDVLEKRNQSFCKPKTIL